MLIAACPGRTIRRRCAAARERKQKGKTMSAPHEIAVSQEEILQALKGVSDPELGVNIVDLGLVHRVAQSVDAIEVALIMTTPACPQGEMLVEQAEQALHGRFPGVALIRVELLRDVVWLPERMSDEGRRQLGLPTDSAGGARS